jgi:hypothetical protein
MITDMVQRTVQVDASFLVHRNPIRAGLDESRDEFIGIFDHQVAIKRQVGRLPQRLDHRRANGQIRYKMPIHDIDVDHGGAALGGAPDLVRQMSKIGRQYGGR